MEQEVMDVGDRGWEKVFGTTANVQEFRALIIRQDELILKDLGGDWNSFEFSTIQQVVLRLERFPPSVKRRLPTDRETERYYNHLPAQPTQADRTHASSVDSGTLQSDLCFLNVLGGDYPVKLVE